MIYQSVSIENVISKVIRDTKIQDTSAIMELYEVIPEAMGMMQTHFELHQTYVDLCIHFHKAKLPAGLLVMPAVEYQHHRLPWSNNSRPIHVKRVHPPTIDGVSVFQSHIVEDTNPVTGNNFISYTIDQIMNLVHHPRHYYWIDMGFINTSFPEGTIRVHYKRAHLDENGNLLIPDNSYYKEALYYWCRAKLIGMGVYEDRIIGEEKCMQRWELNAGRAIDEIDYPTEDQMQAIVANQVRLVPNNRYWENFGETGERMIYG